MSDCRECQFFQVYTCDKYGAVPTDKICMNPCTDFVQLPDAVPILHSWIAGGAPAEAGMLLDAITMRKLDESMVDKAIPWLYSRRDSIEVRSIKYHFPKELLF